MNIFQAPRRLRLAGSPGGSIITLLLTAFFISIASTGVNASEIADDKIKSAGSQTGASEAGTAPPATSASQVKPAQAESDCSATTANSTPGHLNVNYVLYNRAMTLHPETNTSPTASPSLTPPVVTVAKAASPNPVPMPSPSVSTAPLTAGEKLKLYAKGAFLSPGAYGQSVFSGLFNELRDKKDKPDFDTGDFFGDAMTRAARSYAFRVTSGFFEKFAYATVLRQDPRYHHSDKRGVGAKIGYAVSRIFVTQGDRGGNQVNASFLLGGATASAIANVWEREERRDFRHSATRFGVHLGLTALSNILREFLSGQ